MLAYLTAIIVVLAVPACVIAWHLRPRLSLRPFLGALACITVLGGTWSAWLSARGLWTFSAATRTGITLGPHLIFEEAVFYPAAGALCIALYVLGERLGTTPFPRAYGALVLVGTLLFAGLSWLEWDEQPYYLLSQVVLYNCIVTLPLCPVVSRRVSVQGFVTCVGIMATIGAIWDQCCYGNWWTYHAATPYQVLGVPLDDLNFFVFAPTAALSIYLALAEALESSGSPHAAEVRAMGGVS